MLRRQFKGSYSDVHQIIAIYQVSAQQRNGYCKERLLW